MKPVVFIGMMGSGKTTIGKALSEKLNLTWVDTDDFIEKSAQLRITTIFETKGEGHFRHLETEAITSVIHRYQCISTGGGIIVTPKNREILEQDAFVIHLTAQVKTLVARLSTDNRPLLKNTPIQERLNSLIEARSSFYEECADLSINTDELSVEEVVEQIVNSLPNEIKEDFNEKK